MMALGLRDSIGSHPYSQWPAPFHTLTCVFPAMSYHKTPPGCLPGPKFDTVSDACYDLYRRSCTCLRHPHDKKLVLTPTLTYTHTSITIIFPAHHCYQSFLVLSLFSPFWAVDNIGLHYHTCFSLSSVMISRFPARTPLYNFSFFSSSISRGAHTLPAL